MSGSTTHLWLEHLARAEASDRGQAMISALVRGRIGLSLLRWIPILAPDLIEEESL